jgi:uncharacterized protein YbcI
MFNWREVNYNEIDLLQKKNMNKNSLKIQKIESLLSRKIKEIYQYQLKHQLDNISYKLFDRTLIILLEGTITSPEKLLKDNDRDHLAEQVREAIDSIIHPQIQDIIEEVLNVKVIDFLSDTTIDRDLTGAIAIFELKSNDPLDF